MTSKKAERDGQSDDPHPDDVEAMNSDTLLALWGSIEKWEGILFKGQQDLGGNNCPLCHRFSTPYSAFHNAGCFTPGDEEQCPISIKTGYSDCQGTPYSAFHWACSFSGKAETQEAKDRAKEMLDFLRSLLPPGATRPNLEESLEDE